LHGRFDHVAPIGGNSTIPLHGARSSAEVELSSVSFYMFHNTLQTNGTQMAPEARGAGMALFALCLFIGQAIGVPIAAPIVDRRGASPVFWAAAIVLPALAFWFAAALRRQH
jgi:predicted MFS family arabinose efflux permease